MSIVLDSIFPNTAPEKLDVLQSFSKKQNVNLKLLIEALCCGNKALELELHKIFAKIPPEYEEPLELLLSKTQEIVDGNPTERAVLYGSLWSRLEKHFIKLEGENQKINKMTENGPASGDLAWELLPELAEMVGQTLACDAQDIDSLIENSLKSVGGESRKWLLFPTVYKHSTEPCRTSSNPELARRLREIFRLQQEETLRVNRGLRSGKIDGRKLYRVPTTGMSFKRKEFMQDNRWNIAVLIDASSSMKVHWELAESTYATLIEAWRDHNNKLEMFAYTESQQTCTITKLFYNGRLFATTPGGCTPSGQAVIATALLMPRGSRKLILHITDGITNVGVEIGFALKFCENEKIDLVTIGTGEVITKLRDKYGNDHFEILDSIEQLPGVIETLLRRRLLKKKWQ
jgi:Mg-chelatase subunit ChlD